VNSFLKNNKITFKQKAKVANLSSLSKVYAECTQILHRTGKHSVLQMCYFQCLSVCLKGLGLGSEYENPVNNHLPQEQLPKGYAFSSR
jgi:hypothetical protein